MEENKNRTEQQQEEQGGRRRRRRHRGGNSQNQQNQQNQQGQQAQQQKPQQPQQNQQNSQNRQQQKPNGQNSQNQNGKKNKNKQNGNGNNGNNNQNGGNQGGKNQPMSPKNQNGGKDKPNTNSGNNGNNGNNNNGNNGNKGNKQDENRKDTYLYTLDGNLYVNLTNKCSNGCDFCVRNERTSYYGNYLWIRHGDPTVEKVIAEAKGFGDLSRFKEVVFCGFGEPTYKLAEMLALCDFFHEKGLKTRLNTNGQGNLINKRDIVADLKGKIDFVNISLNASCYEKYQAICRSQYKEAGFESVVEFGKLCRRNGIDCRFSIVDCIGEDEVEACKRLAQSVNVPLYVRNYITDS